MDAFSGSGMSWPQLAEGQGDFVEYHLFPNQVLHNKNADEQIQELKRLRRAYGDFVQQWTKEYIWQKEPFHLKVIRPAAAETTAQTRPGVQELPHLWGRTRIGDGVDDEWFIVWLLFQLSQHDTDLAISVTDGDGQFLLIEAALVIPRWIKPENTKNRVWIHGGNIHIIPLPRTPAELTQIPSALDDLATTLAIVFNPKIKTQAHQAVQQAIQAKIAEYPAKAHQFHHARCSLPWQIARVLQERPQTIAPAVEAFYHRDLDGMFLCSKMEKFPPGPVIGSGVLPETGAALSPDKPGMVMTVVRFTRCLYAMIACQRFEPPKVFSPYIPPEEHPDHQAYVLGMKIACGFEILYDVKRKRKTDEAAATAVHDVKTYDFEANREWKAFLHALEGLGYFQGEVKGSREYQRKVDVAKQKYLEDKYQMKDDGAQGKGKRDEKLGKRGKNEEDLATDEAMQRAFQEEIDDLLSRPVDGVEFLRSLDASLRPDDELSWMTVTPEEVDDLLAQRQREFDAFESKETKKRTEKQQAKREKSNRNEADGMKVVMDLMGGMKDFMGKMSSFEGAEFTGGGRRQGDTEEMSFDADRFIQIMQQSLGGSGTMDDEGAMSFDEDSGEEPDEFFDMGSADEEEDEEEEEDGQSAEATATAERLRMRRLMREMDRELQKTKMGEDFEKVPKPEEVLGGEAERATAAGTEDEEEGEEMRPVDVNLNLLRNILDSIEAQSGMAGPGSNILKELRDLSLGGKE